MCDRDSEERVSKECVIRARSLDDEVDQASVASTAIEKINI